MTSVKIQFQTKFCQSHLDSILDKYWNKTFSDPISEITFDLSLTEWISGEEITFLFAWIRKLHLSNKRLEIQLPFPYPQFAGEDSNIVKRRQQRNFYLLAVWGMLYKIGLSDLNFKNIVDNYNTRVDKNQFSKFGKKIIPFRIIDTSRHDDKKIAVDVEYEKFVQGSRIIKGSKNDLDSPNIFKLEADLVTLLTTNSCYSPFESKIISHVITKELLINSMEHSGQTECYFTTSLNDKWANSNTTFFQDHYILEKESCTLDFYRDKDVISKEIIRELSSFTDIKKEKLGERYTPNLSKFNSFKNQSYLEFTFLDFGEGIHSTLKKDYADRLANENLRPLTDSLSASCFRKNEDSRILEFAFLMESSKNVFDREIGYSELIPRGLYFLIDMVRRYKGLLIARSGHGKVVYDFSDRIEITKNSDGTLTATKQRLYTVKEAVRDDVVEQSFFQGTMISIVLPQRTIERLKKSSVRIDDRILNQYVFNRDVSHDGVFPKKVFAPQSYEYLSLAFIHQSAYQELPIDKINKKNGIENYIFKSIDNKLNELLGRNCVLFIDFEFLPERSNYLKIVTYLTNSPKVNEFTKVIFVNLNPDEHKVIGEFKEQFVDSINDNNVPFLFKPIPCLTFNSPPHQEISINNINWVGVRKKQDEAILSKLFFGKIESSVLENIEDKWIGEGNVMSIYDDRVYSIFTDFKDLVQKYNLAKLKFTEEWLIDSVEDGDQPKKDHPPFVFLTSKGSFQKKYISLYETLHFKYLAEYFAKILLDGYIEKAIVNYQTNEHVNFQELDNKAKTTFLETLRFNKLIVVTVSSQLIGVAIRNLIKNNDSYAFLRNKLYHDHELHQLKQTENLKARIKHCPEIIRLSSYFSFDTEKPYENIEKDDKVLIVNDVISTGSLIQRLIDGIYSKQAHLASILTIADARDENTDESKEHKCVFFEPPIEALLVSILSSIKNPNFKLRKEIFKPPGQLVIKRINPILNAVVELKSEHSEKTRILFERPEEIIRTSIFHGRVFQIGHFKQGLSHNSYFTDMDQLFHGENGKNLLFKLKEKIEKDSGALMVSDFDTLRNDLENALNSIKSLTAFRHLNADNPRVKTVTDSIDVLLTSIDSEKESKTSIRVLYEPDFIFHPVFSGIEEVSDETFHEVFGTLKENIISLQRYETRNGWRFPFPAKRFNKITKGKHVLIVDSGALSGHSLVQLIDSIAFLEVGRIDFLTVVGRIDDFQREFYSRLKSIKVKNIKNNNDSDKRQSVVSLNTLFGINLHIPPFNSEDVCPYCKEINLLDSYLKKFESRGLPNETREYIKKRKEDEIKLIKSPSKNIVPSYIPIVKDTEIPDYAGIFLMRDKLGKIDSYRFYHDYFPEFDALYDEAMEKGAFNNPKSLQALEQILICLLHEPALYGILKDLLVNLHVLTKKVVNTIVFEQSYHVKDLTYKWSKYSFLRLAYLFNAEDISGQYYLYTPKAFELLFAFASGDERGLNYLSFLLAEEYYDMRGKDGKKQHIEPILEYLNLKLGIVDSKARTIIKSFIRQYKSTKVESVKDALRNLNKFFLREDSLDRHSALENAFSTVDDGINNLKFVTIKKQQIREAIEFIIPILQEDIFQNLETLKTEEALSKCYEMQYRTLFGADSVYEKMCEIFEAWYLLEDMDIANAMFEEKLVGLSKNLSDFQTDFLFNGSNNSFSEFCLRYRTNLETCIKLRIEKFLAKKPKNLCLVIDIDKFDHYVEVHTDFLNSAIREIFINAEKYARENSGSSINIEISCVKERNNDIVLTFTQNKEFHNPSNKRSGTDEVIRTAFELFCGKEGFRTEHKPNYKIVAIFKN